MTESTQNPTNNHQPVLVDEVIANLDLPKKKVVVDCTLGLGGHAAAMLNVMPAAGKLIGFELDSGNLKIAKKNLKDFGEQVVFLNVSYGHLVEEIKKLKLKGIDGILLDLGIASTQVDQPEKGFSFRHEGPLDMRFDRKQKLTAAEVVNVYSEKELIRIFKEYGEEKKAKKIAHEITVVRKRKPFVTTLQLADFIEKLVKRSGHIHPATRVFQALRIEVNKELETLESALEQAVELLRPKGRIAVISYHSLEDRIVKRFFRLMERDYINEPGKLTSTELSPTLKIVTKKPIAPSSAEVAKNPRSRSAKLRVAEKI
jgi:16S rRNA (cytosine1402-N4)-methyltransferase